jgi:uncharacterized membrane protein
MRETIRTIRSIDLCINIENPTWILTMPFRAIAIIVMFDYTNIVKMKSLLFGYCMCITTAVLWLVMKWELIHTFLAARNTFSLYQSSRILYLINCFQETLEHLVALVL